MPAQPATAANGRHEAAPLYRELEDRILARDEKLGLDLLTRAGREAAPEVGQALRPWAGHAELLGAVRGV